MRLFVVVSIAVVALAVVAGCTQPAPSQQLPASPTPTMAAVHTPQQTSPPLPITPLSQASVSENTITIRNFAFDPQTLTVNAGSIVRWENRDNAPHRIVFIDSAGRDTDVDSGVLSPSQSWSSNQFKQPGTYSYYCKIHPDMKGKIIVV
jgi:plastocyanin